MLERLTNKFTDIIRHISGKANITEKNIQDALNEIKIALLEADVNLRVVRRFINQATEQVMGQKVLREVTPGQQFIKTIHDKLVDFLGGEEQDLRLKGPDTHSVILFVGLQGSGKTTTVAKVGVTLKKQGRKPLLVAADLIRPAAVEQLKTLGQQASIEVYSEKDKNCLKLIKNAINYAGKNQFDSVLIDTTGRLEIDEAMMKQIRDIKKVSQPDELLLVADAMTGQAAVDIAREFDQQLGLTGIILSKFDSDTRGGAALSIKSITGKPIKYIGTGEKIEELELFHPDRIASRILGMGDIVSLVEKAQQTIEVEEAQELQNKIQAQTFTLQDYLDQFRRVKKMGSLQSIAAMIPGLKDKIPDQDFDTSEIKYDEAIILSMTPYEKQNYRIIGPSRRKRISRGSGTSVFQVNKLLKKFEKTRLMMKKMIKNKKYRSQMMSNFGI